MNTDFKNRMLELLSEQAIFGLNNEELMELKHLQTQFPDFEDNITFELAAAKIGLTNLDINAPLPESLRTKLFADAEKHFNFKEQNRTETNFTPQLLQNQNAAETIRTGESFKSTAAGFWQWLGWAAAAAACIALAINIWATRSQKPTETAQVPVAVQTPTPELSAAQKREQLLATADDLIRTELESPKGTKDISGDVVWSNSQQKGFIRFRGLPVNNPTVETYQLWVFDETRNEKYPINGGVFDVTQNGEMIIPIDAEINVRKPKMFAVTGEKPGGVVVSEREKLLAIAKI